MTALDAILKLSEAAKLFFPRAQELFFQKTFSLSFGAVLFFALGIGMVWWHNRTRIKSLEREFEQVEAKPAGANSPQRKTEYERIPEHGVTYALEYPSDEDGDLVAKICVSEPRCSAHEGAPMVPVRFGFDDGLLEGLPYDKWECRACHHTIPESINQRLRIEASTKLISRIKPTVSVV